MCICAKFQADRDIENVVHTEPSFSRQAKLTAIRETFLQRAELINKLQACRQLEDPEQASTVRENCTKYHELLNKLENASLPPVTTVYVDVEIVRRPEASSADAVTITKFRLKVQSEWHKGLQQYSSSTVNEFQPATTSGEEKEISSEELDSDLASMKSDLSRSQTLEAVSNMASTSADAQSAEKINEKFVRLQCALLEVRNSCERTIKTYSQIAGEL